jgi:hypothetical protein
LIDGGKERETRMVDRSRETKRLVEITGMRREMKTYKEEENWTL